MIWKKLGTTILLTTFALNTWAQQSCPLTNSKLTDIRTAAAKLATNITLSAACKTYEKSVNESNKELQSIANQISTSENGTGVSDNTTLAMNAITQLNSVNSVFNHDKCGEELAGFMGYAEAFIDVATGMAPFLAIYGGPAAMPWVLGPALGGAAVKSLISFFKGKSVDMRNPDQSNAFIKNSCSFYNLDLIKSSIDDIQLRQSPRLQIELEQSRLVLNRIEQSAPEVPELHVAEKLKAAKTDVERIGFLQAQFNSDPLEACVYIKAYASHQDARDGESLVDRVWGNYEATVKNASFRLELEKNYFLNELNAAAANVDGLQCKDLGKRWLNKVSSLSQTGIAYLEKNLSAEPAIKQYEAWSTEKKRAEDNVKVLEGKMKFFQEMTSDGFNIEYSEIIRSHRQVQDALFESYRYLILVKMKGLAQAWLHVKQEDAYLQYKNFEKRKDEVEKRIAAIEKTIGEELTPDSVATYATEYYSKNKREHSTVHKNVLTDVCNQLRLTWNAWNSGMIHAKAGRDYCVTFDKVINKLDYPDVQRLCFGTSSKVGYKLSSLKNQVKDFRQLKPEADAILAKMEHLSCKGTVEFKQEFLALPL